MWSSAVESECVFGFQTSWKEHRPTDSVSFTVLRTRPRLWSPSHVCLKEKLLPGHLLYVSVFFDLAGLLVPTEWRSLKEVGRKKKAVAEHQSTATKKNHSYHVPWGEKRPYMFSRPSTYSCLVYSECLEGTGSSRKREDWAVKMLTVLLQMLRFYSSPFIWPSAPSSFYGHFLFWQHFLPFICEWYSYWKWWGIEYKM